jgi:hypothetical protein
VDQAGNDMQTACPWGVKKARRRGAPGKLRNARTTYAKSFDGASTTSPGAGSKGMLGTKSEGKNRFGDPAFTPMPASRPSQNSAGRAPALTPGAGVASHRPRGRAAFRRHQGWRDRPKKNISDGWMRIQPI